MPQTKNEKRKSAIFRMEKAILRYERTSFVLKNEGSKAGLETKIIKLKEIISNTRQNMIYNP